VSAPDGKGAPRLSRRRFVALTGAGLAALSAGGSALGAEAKSTAKKKPAPAAAPGTTAPSAPPAPAPAMTPHQKEFERQKTGTLATLKTLRAYPLPPGGDLPVVFKPMRTPKKGR
jgi:hypothetical protein